MGMFRYLSSGELVLNDAQRVDLIANGYEIEKWEGGATLDGDILSKTVSRSLTEGFADIFENFRSR
jgi:hypothetical protein